MTSLATTADRISRILYGVRRYASLVCIFGTALFASPSLHAQSVAQRVAQPVIEQTNSKLYTVKFDGGDVDSLKQKLKSAFPNDNVVIAPSARHFRLDPFEVRDVLLNELGRTIEFLSDGRLTVEVVERDKGAVGNFWRIGSKSVSTAAVTANLKMRSIAAPHLLRNEARVEQIIDEASHLEDFRIKKILESATVRGGDLSGVVKTEVRPLVSQKVFVVVGNEDGIAGVESFIKAAEQLTVDEAVEKRTQTSSLAPKMRAVVAPHLFASEERLEKVTAEFNAVQSSWDAVHTKLMGMLGIDSRRGGICIEPHGGQKLFVLYGSDEGITGMESLIRAAEQNAAEEDAEEKAIVEWDRKVREAQEKAKKGE